jgi:hypothetical protein
MQTNHLVSTGLYYCETVTQNTLQGTVGANGNSLVLVLIGALHRLHAIINAVQDTA